MSLPVVVLHGYGSSSTAFARLKAALEKHDYVVAEVALADYVTKDDTITFDDLALLFQERLATDRPGFLERGFSLIAHSTGALVARHWLARCYGGQPGAAPVRHLIMLAPANFGSRLAHHGNSVIGRFVSHLQSGDWQTGRRILEALELGSVFQWELAHADLLGSPSIYAAGGIYPFVIMGSEPYRGLRRLWAPANEPGSDGVVRIAGVNLNCRKVQVDFTVGAPSWRVQRAGIDAPLAVLRGVDHHTVCLPEVALDLVLPCLQVNSDADYQRVRDWFAEITARAYGLGGWPSRLRAWLSRTPRGLHHRFQQVVARVVDDVGRPVGDYRLDFMVWDRRKAALDRRLTRYLDENVVRHVHTYSGDRSLRVFYVDATNARRLQARLGQDRDIAMSLAVEDLEMDISSVAGPLAHVPLVGHGAGPRDDALFHPNATTLVELTVKSCAVAPQRVRRFSLG